MDLGVAQQHWAFRSEIKVDVSKLRGVNNAELEFEGLDTFATVYLVRMLLTTHCRPAIVTYTRHLKGATMSRGR